MASDSTASAAPPTGARATAGGARKQAKQANKRGAAANFATIGNMRPNRPTYTGSLAFTARNSVLDAKPFSLNGQNAPKGYYAQNTLALNLGGPIRIPKIYSNDRLVFSFSYQGSRARNPFNSLSTMPSAEERAGDFSQAAVSKGPVTIYDPLTAAPDPADLRARKIAVSMSLIDRHGVKAFDAGPLQVTDIAATRPNTVAVQLQVPLKGLAPGRYICQINVIDEIGRKFAFPRTAMVVQ